MICILRACPGTLYRRTGTSGAFTICQPCQWAEFQWSDRSLLISFPPSFPFCLPFFLSLSEKGSYCILQNRLAQEVLNSRFSCIRLWSSGMIRLCHHTCRRVFFLSWPLSLVFCLCVVSSLLHLFSVLNWVSGVLHIVNMQIFRNNLICDISWNLTLSK